MAAMIGHHQRIKEEEKTHPGDQLSGQPEVFPAMVIRLDIFRKPEVHLKEQPVAIMKSQLRINIATEG